MSLRSRTALLGLLLACSRGASDEAPGASGSAPAPASAAAAPGVPASRPPAPASSSPPPGARPEVTSAPDSQLAALLSEPAARALLEAWASAQNRGDFAAYEALYARRFVGIKRSGPRTRELGRNAWMADRRQMFRRPMKVGLTQVQIEATASLVRVQLEQTWSSGTYRDTGPKQLLLVVDGTALRIAREEMLASNIDKDERLPAALKLHMVDSGLVVLTEDVEPGWGAGPLRLIAGQQAVREVRQDVDPARLPPALGAWIGAPLHAVDAVGRACVTSVRSVALRGRVIPHFSFGRDADGNDAGWPPEKVAGEVWALSEHGGRALVGVLDPPCNGGLWAENVKDPLPSVIGVSAADPALQDGALKALQRLPEHAAIQRRYVEEAPGAHGPWELEAEGHRVDFHMFRRATGPALLVVSATAGTGCDAFGGALTALFEVQLGASPKLTARGAIERELLDPVSAFDLDGDGQLEVLDVRGGLSSFRTLIHREGKTLVATPLLDVPDFDCPC